MNWIRVTTGLPKPLPHLVDRTDIKVSSKVLVYGDGICALSCYDFIKGRWSLKHMPYFRVTHWCKIIEPFN